MRRVASFILGLILCASAHAQDARHDQIAAATARAVDLLRAQIAQEPIGRNLTVQDLLDRTNSSDTLTKTLQRSQMIGGPRWIDPQTCQVRLDISGPRVQQALVSIAASNPSSSTSQRHFSGPPVIPTARQPSMRAIWPAMLPTEPAAPDTTTVWPGSGRPTSSSPK